MSIEHVSNTGMLYKRPKERLNEIDVSKAYTAALIKLSMIPVFNEFDIFQPYTGEVIKDSNLHIDKVNSFSLFFNKTYNVCYGMFLKHTDGIEILAYKQPSTMKKVDYKTIVDELYATKISDNPDEDIYIKKMISNINIGILEKCRNKRQRSCLFDDLSELQHYQK